MELVHVWKSYHTLVTQFNYHEERRILIFAVYHCKLTLSAIMAAVCNGIWKQGQQSHTRTWRTACFNRQKVKTFAPTIHFTPCIRDVCKVSCMMMQVSVLLAHILISWLISQYAWPLKTRYDPPGYAINDEWSAKAKALRIRFQPSYWLPNQRCFKSAILCEKHMYPMLLDPLYWFNELFAFLV